MLVQGRRVAGLCNFTCPAAEDVRNRKAEQLRQLVYTIKYLIVYSLVYLFSLQDDICGMILS